MEHITVTPFGEYFRLVPNKGYMLREKQSGRLFSEAVTKDASQFEAVAMN